MACMEKPAFVSALALSILMSACATQGSTRSAAPTAEYDGLLFDDFDYADTAALAGGGWIVRDKPGHPGLEGARWGPGTVAPLADPAEPRNRLLRLAARTDGTAAGTSHAQICHQRKYLEGTYAARVRFADAPASGPDGDVVVQTFYTASPLRHDFDPEYSEMDWEYLPNGGWGDPQTRIYGVTWQTVQLNPWKAFNQAHQEFRSLDGWHTLVMQAMHGKTRFFIDGIQVAQHGGRNYPVVPMAISFNLWFSPGGLLPGANAARLYRQDIDWVFHARNRQLSPQQIDAEVDLLRKAGMRRVDSVPPSGLPSDCDL
ncbi:MAG TPA: glycoside hydrolase family 16 protein [Paucimonas sp.]|nr:glycoside hydrolase family 16 protein [Paucimonas sp.]